MSKRKIAIISIMIVLLLICVSIDVWYLYIRTYGDEKIVSPTFEIGLQETKDGNTKYFMEVNSFDDVFEIKFNYMLDENQTAFYSQGIQFVGKDLDFQLTTDTFQMTDKRQTGGSGWWKDYTYDQYEKYVLVNGNTNYYMSGDDYNSSLIVNNEIPQDRFFKIQLGSDDVKDVYIMTLKGSDTPKNESTYIGYNTWQDGMFDRTDHLVNYYLYYDIDLICKLLYDAVSGLPNGYNKATVFEFGDYFNYYEFNEETQQYDRPVDLDKAESVATKIHSYYSIKITKHEGKITKASESLFNCVDGNCNYNIAGDYSSDDYFIGKTLINCDLYDFDLVQVNDNNYALKLKQEFFDEYIAKNSEIYLDIVIDLDVFEEEDFIFKGFTLDSGLDNFTIYRCRTCETINGEVVYTGVDL